jgi:hypothetical protein
MTRINIPEDKGGALITISTVLYPLGARFQFPTSQRWVFHNL